MSKQFCLRQRLPTPVACVVRLHYIQAKDYSVGVPILAENELSVFRLWGPFLVSELLFTLW